VGCRNEAVLGSDKACAGRRWQGVASGLSDQGHPHREASWDEDGGRVTNVPEGHLPRQVGQPGKTRNGRLEWGL
jgi:hypothetical protein